MSNETIPTADAIEHLERAAKTLLDACLWVDANEDLPFEITGEIMGDLQDALQWRFPVIWTQEQVDALNAYQSGPGHHFTCRSGNRDDEAHSAYAEENGEDNGRLIATPRGWVCPCCDYRQFWAHDFMFQGAMPNPFDLLGPETLGDKQ